MFAVEILVFRGKSAPRQSDLRTGSEAPGRWNLHHVERWKIRTMDRIVSLVM